MKIAGVGLCHTDLVIKSAGHAVYPFPAVLGHEGSGIVEQVGANVTKVAIAKRWCWEIWGGQLSVGWDGFCRTAY